MATGAICGAVQSGILAGRERDLEAVRSFVMRAYVSGSGPVIAGDPGVGKTTLLDSEYRDALRVVFGLEVTVTPDHYTLCNALLELLRKESAESPVLLLVDDLQWLDRPSAAVCPIGVPIHQNLVIAAHYLDRQDRSTGARVTEPEHPRKTKGRLGS